MNDYVRTNSGILVPSSHEQTREAVTAKIGAATFWAENGFICSTKDDQETDFHQMQPKEAKAKLNGLIEMFKRQDKLGEMDDETRQISYAFVEGMTKVIRMAEKQGPFEDPSARRDRARRLPKSVRVL